MQRMTLARWLLLLAFGAALVSLVAVAVKYGDYQMVIVEAVVAAASLVIIPVGRWSES